MPLITKPFSYTGNIQTFTVPNGITQLLIKAWGAGGANNKTTYTQDPGTGGPGGYSTGLLSVTPGAILGIIIGGGGISESTVATYGGGGAGGAGTGSSIAGPSGGGMSAVQYPIGTYILIAAGGGAGGYNSNNGGGGGALTGYNSQLGTAPFSFYGYGGTQSAGGTSSSGVGGAGSIGVTGSQYSGGAGGPSANSISGGAGAGGGYYGGGGGCGGVPNIQYACGGGGGSSYLSNTLISSSTSGSSSGTTPPNTSDIDYPGSGVGNGGNGNTTGANGGDGYIVISYNTDISNTFTSTGSPQTFTIPRGIRSVLIKAWGAGGANNKTTYTQTPSTGGPGGYSTGLLSVTPGATLGIIVGSGGISESTVATYGGGGAGGAGTGSSISGPSGGGMSAVQYPVGTYVLIAAGGGAGGYIGNNGGGGGALIGYNSQLGGTPFSFYGYGGTQISGGASSAGVGGAGSIGVTGSQYSGGAGGPSANSVSGGAGAGGGYYGGGGGCGGVPNIQYACGGGGGSSYLSNTLISSSTSGSSSGTTPPNTTDIGYLAGVGTGSNGSTAGATGGNGLVIITYPQIGITKNVSSTQSYVNSILTYTILIDNYSASSINNVIFVDTIPTGTTFISGSLSFNGVSSVANPNPPGFNIATLPIGANTITFNVLVSITIPSPNTVTNIASASFTGGYVFNSNTIVTTIVSAILSSTKTINKNYADIGNVLTYTIPITNIGNTTANNIVFIDTIPTNTTLIASSFKQDGTNIVGSPNPPGTTLPKGIFANTTSTITFQILINSIPSPNPITNSASTRFSYTVDPSVTNGVSGSTNTNIVTTTVVNALLQSSKQVNTNYATIGDILTYTIPLSNLGNTTANNVVFLDTIPNNTTLVVNSFKIDGTTITGTPNPPGYTLPNGIGAAKVSTVTFKVLINTIPSPNPITNSASTRFSYTVDPSVINGASGSTNTNIVTTQINNANLVNITKFVDKNFADCGDLLTYTIILPNSGNITAVNVVLFDTIPNGTVFQNNSVKVNGVTIANSNPINGITIPSIGAGLAATITFRVIVQC